MLCLYRVVENERFQNGLARSRAYLCILSNACNIGSPIRSRFDRSPLPNSKIISFVQ